MSRRAQHSQEEEEESIYNLLPQPSAAVSRSALYRSKYPHDTPPTGSTFGPSAASANLTTNLSGAYEATQGTHRHVQAAASFGPKNNHYSDTTRFQQANSQPELPSPSRFEYTARTKAPLETHHAPDSSVVAARTANISKAASKNFISENALAVIMADARRPARGEIDYTKKEDFGKTPAYLDSVKAEIQSEKDYIRQVMESEAREEQKYQPKTHVLPEEERLQLLQQLKIKWEAVNKQYQTITHLVTLDSMGKVRRKEKYELELAEIEKSIAKLSKQTVFVQQY